jgi:uncharacterized protein (DUF58 family)
MLPAPLLILLVLGGAASFLAGAFIPVFQGLGILYVVALSVWCAVDALALWRSPEPRLQRDVASRLSLAAENRVVYRIENPGTRALEVHWSEDFPERFQPDAREARLQIPGAATASAAIHIRPERRGLDRLESIDVRWRRLPAGVLFRQRRIRLPADVMVFPNLVDVRKYELLMRRGALVEGGLARQRMLGQGSEFESLRHYQHGDEMSQVAWKQTAKRSRLIVKNHQPERDQQILVALDVGRATAGEFAGISRLDYLVNATLMVGYVALRQGDWFSLVAFSDRIESYLPPVRGLKMIDRVAKALVRLEPRLVEADYGSACRFLDLKNRKRSLICLLTDIIDPRANDDILAYLARFARFHVPLAVTLSDPEIFRVAHTPLSQSDPYLRAAAIHVLNQRSEALHAMRRRGIGVLDVPPNRLTPELINRYLRIKAAHQL